MAANSRTAFPAKAVLPSPVSCPSQRVVGQIHLKFPDHMPIERALAASVHVVGLDGITSPSRISPHGHVLTISRNRDESGHVFLSWPTHEWGDLVLETSTLPESAEPWSVCVELARGTAHRLRNQLSVWEEGGLDIPDDVRETVDLAIRQLAQAVLADDPQEASLAARRSIETSVRAIYRLSRLFGEQVAPLRLQNQQIASFWTACRIPDASWLTREEADGFDLLELDPGQAQGQTPGRPVAIGPLVDASPGGMDPSLMELDTFEARRASLLARIHHLLALAPPETRLVHAVAGLNGTGHKSLSYPQQLQLTLDVLQAVEDHHSAKSPVLVSFDYPWGENLARSVGGSHPLQIADALLRRGTRISMLGLEVNLDYANRGSLARDPMQWLELVDLWSQLGLPLVFLLRVPTGLAADHPAVRPGMNDRQRMELLQTVLSVLMARPMVQGVIWQELYDREDSPWPGAGLLDASLRPKPVWGELESLYRTLGVGDAGA